MASSVSPCSAKVFIRFDSRCSAVCHGYAPLPSAYPATAHQWCCQCCRPSCRLWHWHPRRDNAHKATRSPSHTRRARSKNFDAFTVDVVRRDVRQTRKTGGNFLFAVLYSSAFVSAMPDLMASRRRAGATVCSRRIRSRTRFGSISGKRTCFNHRLVACRLRDDHRTLTGHGSLLFAE